MNLAQKEKAVYTTGNSLSLSLSISLSLSLSLSQEDVYQASEEDITTRGLSGCTNYSYS